MVARERQMQICDLLSINNAVQIADLAALFGVSSETIRRDLLALEKGGLLHRTHGGAISLSRMAHGKDYAQRLEDMVSIALKRGGHDNITAILIACEEVCE